MHTQTGAGVPLPHRNYENLKFGLKFSVCAPITSGIVGIFSTNFPGHVMDFGLQTHIDPPELLVYRQLITQVHTARGSFWSHLLAAIAARRISIT